MRPTGGLFYGWVIVAVMAVVGAVTMAMGGLNFGLFIKPMGDELGIGRSTFGWAFTARQVASSATSPLIGRVIDRHGSRILLPIAALITGGGMIGLGLLDHGWQLVLLFALMGLVGMSGPGALVTSVPVLKWFVRGRGRAVAFMSLGVPLGAVIFVPLTQVLIDAWGWRTAWIVLAVIGTAVIVPVSLVFIRRQPEDMGLLPDGARVLRALRPGSGQAPQDGGSAARRPLEAEVSWTSGEAARSWTFWRLVVVFSVVALGIGTIGVHRIPAFLDRGVDARLVSYATALDAVFAGVSTFAMGFLVGTVPVRVLGVFGFICLAVAGVVTIYADTTALVFLSMGIFGLGIGGMMFLQNFIWAEYFGRAHLGGIRGLVMPIQLMVGGVGAPVAGYVYDATGSYNSIWWGGVALVLAAAVLVAMTGPPRRRAPG